MRGKKRKRRKGRVWGDEREREIGGNGRIMKEVRESFINNSILPFFWRRQIGNLHPWYCRLNDLKKWNCGFLKLNLRIFRNGNECRINH